MREREVLELSLLKQKKRGRRIRIRKMLDRWPTIQLWIIAKEDKGRAANNYFIVQLLKFGLVSFFFVIF